MPSTIEHNISQDLQCLTLPVQDNYGALKKVNILIEEMNHENMDWKIIVEGIRTYFFDYMYDISPYSEKVLPVLFHFLEEATKRKKISSFRAFDTFFDRYSYIIRTMNDGGGQFTAIRHEFDTFAVRYIDLILSESNEEFYFDNAISKIITLARLLDKTDEFQSGMLSRIAEFIYTQYRLYIKASIITSKSEIIVLSALLDGNEHSKILLDLLISESDDSYSGKLKIIEDCVRQRPDELFDEENSIVNFAQNTRSWEKITLMTRDLIEKDIICGDQIIINLLGYLVKKSNEGSDRELNSFISKTIASLCAFFANRGRFELLKSVIGLVMPVLLKEIENEGNYTASFTAIYNIGKAIIESDNITQIDFFEDILVQAKFCFPKFSGIASDWSVITNSSHLENIRTWMKLIELNPPMMKKLSASLIVNLKLGGVFLKDTDVFQRDISALLNSRYGDVFYLIISLAAVFPAFYHDIGATGNIRAFTEKIDTDHRMDNLIHFIRKQVHVESSSRTVLLIQKVMEYWMTGDKNLLEGMVPKEVYENLDHIYAFINLDDLESVKTIYEEARKYFTGHEHDHFWDLLNEVGKDNFINFVESRSFPGVAQDEKELVLVFLREYFLTKNPTEMTKILLYIENLGGIDMTKTNIWKLLYEISDDEFRTMFDVVRLCDISKVNIEKFILFLHVYRMLYDKYNFSEVRAVEKLEQYAGQDLFSVPAGFFDTLRGNDVFAALETLLEEQNALKTNILLSDRKFEPLDTIEFKRHIAFGIPSMYGSYKERKFDTLKVVFHMNMIRSRFFEMIHENIRLNSGSIEEYVKIKRFLKLFYRTYLIDGLANQEMINLFNLLETPNMKLSQFRDIVNQLLNVHGGIADRFNETFRYVCREAIRNIGIEKISPKYVPRGKGEKIEAIIDRFLRDQILQSPLIQLFDNLLMKLKENILENIGSVGDIVCLNRNDEALGRGRNVYDVIRLPDDPNDPYDPFDPYDNGIYAPIHDIKKLAEKPSETGPYAPIWEIGNKAHGLLFVANMEGVNTPPGIILSSELYKRLESGILDDPMSRNQMIYILKRYVDTFSKNRFGNPKNPQLFSVRSGAVFSMPGVMSTITNVGLSDEILELYAEKDAWFAYDCHRRFLQDIATSYYNIDRQVFENLMRDMKRESTVVLKENMPGEQMKKLALLYRNEIEKRGFHVPVEPYEQLLLSIIAVYRSWDSSAARSYRKFVNISDEWGTAVIIQNMVFGNLSKDGVSGVVNSQYQGDENIYLVGEYKTRAQGHDIVNGVAKVFPISEEQKKLYGKSRDLLSLEKTYPDHYRTLFNAVKRMRDKWGNDLQIEFTFEDSTLYILQVRGMTGYAFNCEEPVDGPSELMKSFIGEGLAASGGAVSGRVVFDIDRIDEIREKFSGDRVVLVRPETCPEDVVGLQKSDGILTCLGGMTSHAVLQMRRFGKAGVSDFSAMHINAAANCAVVKLESGEDLAVNEGDFITINGANGHVYTGYHPTKINNI